MISKICTFIMLASAIMTASLRAAEEKPLDLCPARHLTGIASAPDGSLWVTAENAFVYQFKNNQWITHDRNLEGFPDSKNFTCAATDTKGRIWVGTVDSGIGIFHNGTWKSYGRTQGPVSTRIYDIAAANNGIVAIAHSEGVTLWLPETDSWQDITVVDGLLKSPAAAVAFNKNNDLIIAYDCGGLATANAPDYNKITNTAAQWFFDKNKRSHVPLTATGRGLPSNLMNDVAVTATGKIICTTVNGIGFTDKKGEWNFLRGEEYRQRIEGLHIKGKLNLPKEKDIPILLPEDYTTAIIATEKKIWIGTRSKGAAGIDTKTMKIAAEKKLSVPIKAMTLHNGKILAATYGEGVKEIASADDTLPPARVPSEAVRFPAERKAPDEKEVAKLVNLYKNSHRGKNDPPAVYIREDWETKGNWCERYGTARIILCAINAPWDDLKFFPYDIDDDISIFPDANAIVRPPEGEKEILRSWVHTIRDDKNPNVLHNTDSGIRTEAEWDDHGEAYPRTFDGPDIWVRVDVPSEPARGAFYFYSPNNRDGVNGERDYLIEVYQDLLPLSIPESYKSPSHTKKGVYETRWNSRSTRLASPMDFEAILNSPVTARCRAHDLGNGVYKEFMFTPGRYIVRIGRNGSFNTLLNGIFLSDYSRKNIPEEVRAKKRHPFKYCILPPYSPNITDADISKIPPEALKIWPISERLNPSAKLAEAQNVMRSVMWRIADADKNCDAVFKRVLAIRMPVWTRAEQREFTKLMRESWYLKQERYSFTKSNFYPASPDTLDTNDSKTVFRDDWITLLPGGKRSEIEYPDY